MKAVIHIISIKFMREKLNACNKVKLIKIYFLILQKFFMTNQMLAMTNFMCPTTN